jgi:putative protease
MSALRAAVGAGADAVYLGLDAFNARKGAENFTLETLGAALRFAHLRGVRVYLTMNVVILPDEIGAALRMVEDAWALGVDAVIVQDLGLLSLVRRLLPDVRVHASTQLNAHSSASVEALCGLGAVRVTLAREMSFQQIASAAAAASSASAQVETFAHGALCMCYSGQCLMSSLIGGRSANRGECAQPCRLPYELVDEAGAVLADVGAHLLSPKDLASIQVLPSLVASGTSALKIEGRMKNPEYVALVTGVYRAALDRAVMDPEDYEVRDGETSVLEEAFTRGFTEGYLIGERGNEMMSYTRPNNRGVLVGRVATSKARTAGEPSASIELLTAVDADDTIEVWTSRGRFAQRLGDMAVGDKPQRSAPAGARVDVRFDEPVGVGDRVFRVRNAALSDAAHRVFDDPQGAPIALAFHVRVVQGEPLLVEVEDPAGRRGSGEGAVVEAARTVSVSAADVSEHVGRLGGTPYTAASWDIELSPGAGIAFSALHAARRAAVEDYERESLAPWSGRVATHPDVPLSPVRRRAEGTARLVVAAADIATATACLEAGADEAHVPAWALDPRAPSPDRIVGVSGRICHDADMVAMHEPLIRDGRAVAGTLGSIRLLAEKGVGLQAHWGLNATNEHAVAQLAEMGCTFAWLSPELRIEQVAAIAVRSRIGVGVAVAGRQEMMVTEHCILMAQGDCARQCPKCSRRKATGYLKDRRGYLFPVTTDPLGRSHVYNSVPLDVSHALGDILAAGVSAVRVDVESDSKSEALDRVRRVRAALNRALAGKPIEKQRETTSGHFFKGLL